MMLETTETFIALALALGLGLLVGMQRERTKSSLAGVRTFPIITLLGALTALLAQESTYWLVATGLIALAAMLVTGNLYTLRSGQKGAGITTELAALMMYLVGAGLVAGYTVAATVVAGVLALLLQFKAPLHRAARGLGERETQAIFKFTLLALVILPLLPNQTYGPYDVLNPFKIWLVVVLIVGISVTAYITYRMVGAHTGALLGGLLGGLISSTATTVSYARQAKAQPNLNAMAATVIVLASTIVYVRVLFEIAVIAPSLIPHTIAPLGAMLIFMSIMSAVLFRNMDQQHMRDSDTHASPTQLGAALIFGALYALVLLLVAVAKEHFGVVAIYGIAVVSGLTDVDAITLSTAELFKQQRLDAHTAWQVILIATLSNLVFKAAAVALLANRALGLKICMLYGFTVIFGLIVLFGPDLMQATGLI